MKSFLTVILAFGICLFMQLQTYAQIKDFDALAVANDTLLEKLDLKGSVGFSANFEKQRVELFNFSTSASLALEKKKTLVVLTGSNRTQVASNVQLQNTGYFNLKHLHGFRKRFYPELFVQYQWDAERGLEQRFLSGANLRYNVFRKENNTLLFAIGFMYEQEIWNNTAVPDEKKPIQGVSDINNEFWKYNFRFKYTQKFIKQKAFFSVGAYVQGRPDDVNYLRIAPFTNIHINLIKGLAFNSEFSGIYDFKPVVPIDHFYYSLTNSLVISF